MSTYVALLRGINVSGQKSIRMADLCESFAALRHTRVRSYLQSGNVVFDATLADTRKLAAQIKARIAKDLGHDVETLVLSAPQLARIARKNPLLPASGADEKLFHATFLFEPVAATDFRKLKLPAQDGEHAVLVGQTVLLHCPHGYGKTKLNNNFFERALKVPATTRNWRTVRALHAMCSEKSSA